MARQALDDTLASLLQPQDSWEIVPVAQAANFDAAVMWNPVGHEESAQVLSVGTTPAFPLGPPRCFHPFFAAAERCIEAGTAPLLPAHNPAQIQGSLRALRARKALAGQKLLLVDEHQGDARAAQVANFAAGLSRTTGLEIVRAAIPELLERAAAQEPGAVENEWTRLESEVFTGPGEFAGYERAPYLEQVTRLTLALRSWMDELGACGVTVSDIESFLLKRRGQVPQGVMPNLAYGALVDEGYLACEEADVEVLASEALLLALTGQHPSMSNIYLAYRDAFDAAQHHYAPEMECQDYLQCCQDHKVTIAHFSTAGILPRNMRQEERVAIREALPSWAGQAMVSSTPRLGPVHLLRLGDEASTWHHVAGEATDLKLDDSKGWYRGRWLVRLPSVPDFVNRCLHQHYALGPDDGEGTDAAFQAWERLTGITAV